MIQERNACEMRCYKQASGWRYRIQEADFFHEGQNGRVKRVAQGEGYNASKVCVIKTLAESGQRIEFAAVRF